MIKFEQLTNTTWASEDFRYVIEQMGEGAYQVSEQGKFKRTLNTLAAAQAWTSAFDRGEVTSRY